MRADAQTAKQKLTTTKTKLKPEQRLRQVMASAALGLGVPMPSLLARFGQDVDLPSSLAQLAILMDTGAEMQKQTEHSLTKAPPVDAAGT